jgi:hypothetical protein
MCITQQKHAINAVNKEKESFEIENKLSKKLRKIETKNSEYCKKISNKRVS